MPTQKGSAKVSEKNTKQEIWEAYHQLLAEIQGEPVTFKLEQKEPAVPDALRSLAELKLRISQELDKVGEELLKSLNSLQDLRVSLAKDRQSMVERLQEQRKAVEAEISRVKEAWEQEKRKSEARFAEELRQKEVLRAREEEEYQYTLSLKRRQENDEYERQRVEKERTLKDREQALERREKEIVALEKELDETPAKVAQAVKEAQESLARQLGEKQMIELRELKAAHANEVKVAEMRIANLEVTVKSQAGEIENLRKQLAEASRQLKEMAVSAIESRAAEGKTARVE
ncbi:hypothetical protein COS81_00360 [candidate division WWE3 bacterium CG06_land_8_20_14_3_00_42_16]|uniref:Uncharacterized protein n=4 Tax=Katanobacteria TaxID=422282 RepID=A0A2M7APK0_UNCKA|nr:MAG: hypothetical protein COS81_00360 [candidate division WWE3 bacterium CG06_land_8_20_14_3_00_42_16]PJA37335.1 MAG: hypothetical protein CO181_03960 [candidate division WWE3 bacterium CG_4_9_14_3_um_filter_43_9]PJC69083.1 MAG: hypothetical protein CO015_01760 [candidate division WWE3 bacterium CG_4_8_14_3_um_filter_42_11]